MRLNNSDTYEPIMISLTPEAYPIAFKNKVDELIEQGMFKTRPEAENYVKSTPIELEVYYEKGTGLFAVQSDAVESGTIYSPYTQELLNDTEEDN